MTRHVHAFSFPASILAMAVLTACGGGSDGGETVLVPAPAPAVPPVNLAGTVVIDGLVKNAVVCLDLNANGACDASEPASVKTGADGAYSITFDRSTVSEAQQAAASLIALMVPGELDGATTTVDQNAPTATVTDIPYVLKQVPGKAGQVNPLTTLVTAGMTAGMAEGTARANAAQQLGIAVAKIDNYQDDAPLGTDVVDNARMAALVTADALENGATLEVSDPSAARAGQQGDLRSLTYTDAANYRYLDFVTQDRAAGAAVLNVLDGRSGKANGADLTASALYNQAYLTPQGWTRCDASVPIASNLGRPARSTSCGVSEALVYRVDTSVADRPMADVITELAADTANGITSSAGLLAALGSAKFPANSFTRKGSGIQLNQPIVINSISADARPQAVASNLDELVAAHPGSGVNLTNSKGSLSLGVTSSSLKNLRVAFIGTTTPLTGIVQYYECNLNAAGTTASNCLPVQTGTYSIETVYGARVMRFAEMPATPASPTDRMYVEVNASTQSNGVIESGNWVFAARQNKPGISINISRNTRLGSTGWTALKSQLAI